MDANPFLDYLNEHRATASLAASLVEILAVRRASAARRVLAGLRPIRVGVAS